LDILKIESKGMGGIIELCIFVMLMCIALKVIRFRSEEVVEMFDLSEVIFNIFKAAFYSLLAWCIYIVLKKMNFPKVDVLTFLTFLLACFEAAHNFMNSIGNWLASVIAIYILQKNKYY
jgi:hypothetical protein